MGLLGFRIIVSLLHPGISVINTDVEIFDERMKKLLYKG
jgi:hypothetical protein